MPVEQGIERKTMKEPEQLHRMLDQMDRKEQRKTKSKKANPISNCRKLPQNQQLMTDFLTRSSREKDSREQEQQRGEQLE